MKLWKHHAAQPEADRINAVAAERGEPWLPRYGGKISSEWFFAKALQILRRGAGDLRGGRPADRGRRLGRLAAHRRRDAQQLHRRLQGAVVEAATGFPATAYFAALDPRFERVVDDKMSRSLSPLGSRAGGLSERGGRLDGAAARHRRSRSPTSTPTSRRRPSTVTEPGHAGRDHGHEHLPHPARRGARPSSRACAASSRTASCPGLFGFEAGQSAVGDIFGWFVETRVPPAYHERGAQAAVLSVHAVLESEAAASSPGETGLARARLVERQPLGPRRRGPQRPARRRDAGDAAQRASTGR